MPGDHSLPLETREIDPHTGDLDRERADPGNRRVHRQTPQSERVLRRKKRGAVTQAEADAQAELRGIVVELESVRSRLVAIHARLPVPPEETAMLVGEKEMDVSTEVRSVIECVLNDSIEPAIRDLAAAASYRPKEKAPG
jgi:hypothetical protein